MTQTVEERRARRAIANAKWRAANPGYATAWSAANAERKAAYNAAWYVTNSVQKRADNAAWAAANPEKMLAYGAKWGAANRAAVAHKNAAWRAANPGAATAATNAWRAEHPGKWNATQAKRHVAKLQATPLWLSPEHHEEIRGWYQRAAEAGLHVDHIVPLQGENVSGLHAPWNMQLLTPSANSRKGNL